jgi:curved DNA-binding protein CbpA
VADAADPYKVLQVDPEAEDEVIQAAYRRLARRYHPDVAPGPEAAARMAAINAAWDRIGDPVVRATFDRERAIRLAHAEEVARQAASRPAPTYAAPAAPRPATPPPPDEVSRDWTSGRSSQGGGYDPSMRSADGLGAAGPAPGNPSGSVLNFGRYAGWSLGEIARTDLEYLEWLDRMPIGRTYQAEIDTILRKHGRRIALPSSAARSKGIFRRR